MKPKSLEMKHSLKSKINQSKMKCSVAQPQSHMADHTTDGMIIWCASRMPSLLSPDTLVSNVVGMGSHGKSFLPMQVC
jgi:hypothetical protein